MVGHLQLGPRLPSAALCARRLMGLLQSTPLKSHRSAAVNLELLTRSKGVVCGTWAYLRVQTRAAMPD